MEIQLWREILDPYYLAVDELTVKFNHIIHEHRNFDRYSPIEQVIGRVKSISSILETHRSSSSIFREPFSTASMMGSTPRGPGISRSLPAMMA